MSECRIRKKRSRIAAWGITFLLPLLLVFYSWFMEHRPRLHDPKEWNLQDTLIQNSDLLMAAVFLVLSLLPFYLMFDRRKAQARDLVPIALMAAMCVVGRTAFSIVPLPNFKPCSAIIMITAIVFGPETGFLTGALTAFVSNFIFGQGPWTPFQMFSWGILGFIAGLLAAPLKKSRIALTLYAVLSGVLYSFLMDIWTVLWADGAFNISRYLAAILSAAPFTAIYAVSNTVFLLLFARSIGKILDRLKTKYAL